MGAERQSVGPMMDKGAEIARLRAKLDARRGQPGYRENVLDLERRIADLQGNVDAD